MSEIEIEVIFKIQVMHMYLKPDDITHNRVIIVAQFLKMVAKKPSSARLLGSVMTVCVKDIKQRTEI